MHQSSETTARQQPTPGVAGGDRSPLQPGREGVRPWLRSWRSPAVAAAAAAALLTGVTAAAAADLLPIFSTELAVPAVGKLPRGVSDEPEYRVGEEVRALVTFDPEVAAEAAESAGGSLPPPPPGLDGARFEMEEAL